MKLLTLIATLLVTLGIACAGTPYSDLYVDAVWNDLTGASTFQRLRLGTRDGQHDYYLALRNEWSDTRGTRLPYQASVQGTSLGLGYRYYFPHDHLFAAISYGRGVAGANKDRDDFRAGLAGYNAWEHAARYTDLYGELFWVERADDAFLNVRVRPGVILHRDDTGRLWTYGVAQLWASGTGDNGTENRVEAGVGLGYVFHGNITANAELRVGYSYRGAIPDRAYLNPTLIVAGSF